MVGTLKSNLMQNNSFELFALTGGEDEKNLGLSAYDIVYVDKGTR